MPPPRVPEEGHLPGTRWPMSAIHQPPRGFGPGLGPRKALLSPRDGGGTGMHLQAAHSPAGSDAEASWEPWPGTGLPESALGFITLPVAAGQR